AWTASPAPAGAAPTAWTASPAPAGAAPTAWTASPAPAGAARAGAAAASTAFSTPTKTPQGTSASPSSGASWKSVSKRTPPSETELNPAVRCNRCISKLWRQNFGGKVDSATCQRDTCPGSGIILKWPKDCEFCARPIEVGTVSFTLEKGGGAHANAHFWNCLKDVVPGCPTDSAVAVSASKNDVGKDCVYCKAAIKDTDILIGLCKTPLHFTCAKRSRKLCIAEVEQVQDDRH
ncbi:unnamed protein product, partial [Laminaria digitata]